MRISDWSSDVCSSDLISDILSGEALVALDRQYVRNLHHVEQRGDARRDILARRGGGHDEGVVARHQFGDERRDILRQVVREGRSEEHTSELQSLMRISYAVLCLKKKKIITH